MLTCRWCGEIYEDNEPMDRTENGFWCEVCNCFTYYDHAASKAAEPLLLLEEKGSADTAPAAAAEIPGKKLRKHISPLRYPGGKSHLISYLYGCCHADRLDTLTEVFAGGASLGLSLLDAGVINRLVLNDIDQGVYAVWDTILNRPEELKQRLLGPLPTHTDLAVAKAHLAEDDTPSPLLAWHYLMANRLSYSGILMANPQGGKCGSQEDLLSRWQPETLIRRIDRIHAMRERIELHRQDCCQFIEEYAWWLPDSTLFIDPPYFKKGPQLYRHSFSKDDHERLADTIQDLQMEFPGPAVLITYDDDPYIRELYAVVHKQPVFRNYSIAN